MNARIDQTGPFKGLNSFTEADAAYFVGRESEADLIAANLIAYRLTVLYGTSGIGKSSVLLAGVLPALRARAARRPGTVIVYFSDWIVDPVKALSQQINAARPPTPETTMSDTEQRPDSPPDTPSDSPLVQALRPPKHGVEGADNRPDQYWIILDQFEELFLYNKVDAFADDFARVLNDPAARAHFLIAIRQDALAQLDAFKGKIPDLFGNYYRIRHMNRENAERAIREPVAAFGAAHNIDIAIDDALVKAVLKDVQQDDSAWDRAEQGSPLPDRDAPIELPYLQLVMERLWQNDIVEAQGSRLRYDTYERLGQAHGIVQAHLDRALNRLGHRQKLYMAEAFRFLVTRAGTKIAYTASELAQQIDARNVNTLADALQKLSAGDARILRPVEDHRYELFHDVLSRVVLPWSERYRARQQLIRRILIAMALGLIVATLIVMAVLISKSQQDAARARDTARRNELAVLARLEVDYGDPFIGIPLALEALKGHGDFPAVAQYTLAEIAYAPGARKVWEGQHKGEIASMAVSADGTRAVTGSNDGTAIVWTLPDGEKQCTFTEHTNWVNVAVLLPDGTRAITSSRNDGARLWWLDTCELIAPLPVTGVLIQSLAVSPDGVMVAAGLSNGNIQLWDVSSQEPLTQLSGLHMGGVLSVAFSADGSQLLSGSDDGTAGIWELDTGLFIPLFDTQMRTGISRMAFAGDDATALTGYLDGTLQWWNTGSGKVERTIRAHEEAIHSIAIAPNGESFITASADGTIIWWTQDGGILHRLRGHGAAVVGAQFVSAEAVFSVSADNQRMILWDLTPGARVRDLIGHHAPVAQVVLSADGQTALSGAYVGEDGKAQAILWNVAEGKIIHIFELDTDESDAKKQPVQTVALNADGYRAFAAFGKILTVWDTTSGLLLKQYTVDDHDQPIEAGTSGTFGPDGQTVICGLRSGVVVVWDLQTNTINEWAIHRAAVTGVAIIPGERLAVSSSYDQTVALWNIDTGEVRDRFILRAHVIDVAVSANGERIMAGDASGLVTLWKWRTGDRSWVRGAVENVNSVAIDPAGKWGVFSSTGPTINLAQLDDGRVIRRYTSFDNDEVRSVALSPDNNFILAGYADGRLTVWPIDTVDELVDWTQHNREIAAFACQANEIYGTKLPCEP